MSKLLIVDDERSLREVLQMVFKKEGYQVSVAGGYQEALQQLRSGVFDLVISDIKMSDGSGIDLLRDVNSISLETLVVIITAYATTENAIQALKMGAEDYILKDNENFVDELKIDGDFDPTFYREVAGPRRSKTPTFRRLGGRLIERLVA